jgi:hypothetical protein
VKQVEFFRFWLPPNAWNKKPYLSTYRMTVEEAAQRFPGAKPDPLTREVRNCPETPEEALRKTMADRAGR